MQAKLPLWQLSERACFCWILAGCKSIVTVRRSAFRHGPEHVQNSARSIDRSSWQ
jgi:hypothetical protein